MSSASQSTPGNEPRPRRSGFRALNHPAYRVYFATMLLRGSAIWTLFVTIPWYLVSNGASAGDVGLVTALQYISVFVIAPLGGVLGDRINRATILLIMQAASSVLAATLAVLASQGVTAIAPVAVCAFVLGVLIAAELPIRQAYLTELVPPTDVSSAVSLHATAWNTTRFVGPGLAGLLIAGPGTEFAFGMASAASAVVALSIPIMERLRPPRPPRALITDSVLTSLVAGFRYVAGNPTIRWALAFVTAIGIFGIIAFQTLIPVYSRDILGLEAAAYGGLMALWGLGAVVSTYLVTALVRGDRWPWMIGGLASFAVLFTALSFTTVLPVAYAIAFGIGLGQTAVAQNALVTVQRATSDAMRGRVMGVYVMVFQGSNPIGALLAGLIGEVAGVRAAMLACAAALGMVAIGGVVARRRTRP